MKYIKLLLLYVLVTACATTAAFEKTLDAWVGLHVDRLVLSWGAPSSSFKLSDGSTAIEYSSSRIRNTSPPSNSMQYYPPNYVTFWCKARFMVSPEGLIKGWSHEGNDCKECSEGVELCW